MKRKNTDLTVRRNSSVSRTDEYEYQVELAKEMMQRQAAAYGSKGCSSAESYAMKFEIVKHEDGTMTATPRAKPFKDLDEEHAGLNLMIRSPFSGKMGIDSPKRGKYNDEDRLGFNEYGTVEVGETAAVGSVG